MDSYFPIILTQNILLSLAISWFIFRSTILKQREKEGFYLCLAVELMIAMCEIISTCAAGNPNLIWLQAISSFLNVGLTPLLPAIPLLVIGESKKARAIAMIPVAINLALLLGGKLFSIDPMGNYSRDPLFVVFIISYLFNMLLLTYRSLVFSSIHQNQNAVSLLLICIFMISSTTIQLRLPQIHFSWFCVTVTILLFFIYYGDTIQQMDNLTGLLNRQAFRDHFLRRRKKISGIMMIDLDDFKGINDTHGHLMGDRFLIAFALCLRRVFQHSGLCYRMGGDEFCVLLSNTPSRQSPEALTQKLQAGCSRIQGLPGKIEFSCGYQILEENMDIDDAMDLADKAMYAAKADRKQKRSFLSAQ